MPPVPVLMVLYSSDAVEVRYSDGSYLEISPCGSAMVHLDAPDRMKHPRQDQTKKTQKRTRFVTSEHRRKVMQALDFRNRFAERPYLCEDLQSEGEIVALYAKIDSIAWPKLPDEAKVDILPDGSRRVTSLDEFATLVVSPHGHDFTVCYLCRISEDRSGSKEHLTQNSDSTSSDSTRKPPHQISTTETQSQGNKVSTRPNEAVVHPFETADKLKSDPVKFSGPAFGTNYSVTNRNSDEVNLQLQRHNSNNTRSEFRLSLDRKNSEEKVADFYIFDSEQRPHVLGVDAQDAEQGERLLEPHIEDAVHRQFMRPDKEDAEHRQFLGPYIEDAGHSQQFLKPHAVKSEQRQQFLEPHTEDTGHSQQFMRPHTLHAEQRQEILGVDTQERESKSSLIDKNNQTTSCIMGCTLMPKDIPCSQSCDTDATNKRQTCKSSDLFSNDSPDSHDISSISRSSSPDGLRTTIDSEATFMHENMAEVLPGFLSMKKHSSPTQYTSSPNNAWSMARSDKPVPDLCESLSGSFLGSMKGHNLHEQVCSTSRIQQEKQSNCCSTGIIQLEKQSNFCSSNKIQLKKHSDSKTCDPKQSDSDHNNPITKLKKQSGSNCCSLGMKQPEKQSNLNFCSRNTKQQSDSVQNELLSFSVVESSSTMSADSLELEVTTRCQQSPSKDSGEQDNLDKHFPSTEPNSNFNCNKLMDVTKQDFEIKSEHVLTNVMPCNSRSGTNLLTQKFSNVKLNDKEQAPHKQHRQCYIWTTKHCSRNDCPVMWIHPLKLAFEGTNVANGNSFSHPTVKRLQTTAPSFDWSAKNCTSTTVPSPLPLTCPFQHKHRWSLSYHGNTEDTDSDTFPGEFQHGRLKIVISEGVVYRLVHKSDMSVAEIYPGDGSVLVSQGVRGHFFTHYLLAGDQLEERTYSLKSLPPRQVKGPYSVEKLIATASRLLNMNEQWEQRGLKENVPCWKKEVIAVVEPLSSSLLEECHVSGLGKFSAFTNGRVRVVFDDRTALDMVCNFSKRVKECLQHTQELLVSLPGASSVSPPAPTVESIFGASTGRLMMPSGKYVTVDIKKPGPYRRYIQAAKEWATWVAASPLERHHFYTQHNMPVVLQQAAELELKKIFCFKYVLEQTALIHQQQLKGKSQDSTLDTSPQLPSANEDFFGANILTQTSRAPNHHIYATFSHSNLLPDYNLPGKREILCQPTTSVPDHENKVCSSNSVPGCNPSLNSAYSPQDHPGEREVLGQPTASSFPGHENGVSFSNSAMPSSNPSLNSPHSLQDHPGVKVCEKGNAYSDWATREEHSSYKKSEDIFMGFESIRRVLSQNSDLINDIDKFLESSRKTC